VRQRGPKRLSLFGLRAPHQGEDELATPTQIKRRGRWSFVLGTLIAAVALGAVATAYGYFDIVK
jgi:hypothetical protein